MREKGEDNRVADTWENLTEEMQTLGTLIPRDEEDVHADLSELEALTKLRNVTGTFGIFWLIIVTSNAPVEGTLRRPTTVLLTVLNPIVKMASSTLMP